MNEIPSKDSEAKLSKKDIISQLKIELDPNKRSTSEPQHEQSVAIYDILDSPYDTQELYSKYGHLLYDTPYQCSVINIIAHMTMQQIASFMGY